MTYVRENSVVIGATATPEEVPGLSPLGKELWVTNSAKSQLLEKKKSFYITLKRKIK